MNRRLTRNQTKKAIRKALLWHEQARRSYRAYLDLSGGDTWINSRFSCFLADELQKFLETDTGNAYDILQIASPPQHGKSMTLTEALASWYLMKHPDRRVILVSYNEESAERFTRRNREKLQQWGPILFGVEIGGVNRATEFELKRLDGKPCRGRLISRGILSGITGNAADLIIMDDPVKNREEADSVTSRDKVWAEWVNSVKSRLSAGAKVILIMTPWHEDDLAARMRKTEKNLRLLRFPVEAVPTLEEPDLLGRAAGDPLCPELGKDKKWLEQYKDSYLNDPMGGARAWMALYMCSPRAEGGNLVKREWWRFYDAFPDNQGNNVEIISVDAAFKDGINNDYVAVTVWRKAGAFYYLLECINEHLTFTKTLDAIRELRQRFPNARAVLIEDKANGSAIIDVLQKECFCIPVDPKGGKIARVQGVSAAIESGHVLLPRSAPWLEAYLNQWTAFPAAAHDDMVDSSSQALTYLFNIPVPVPPTDAERRRIEEEEAVREALTSDALYDIYGGGW